MDAASSQFDVIVIGGGPGGSTAGTLLAKAGKRVLILEREVFPRFHIGESLLPFGNAVMEETGVWDKVRAAGFMPKHGAEFVTSNGTLFERFWFRESLTPQYSQTFQVERAKFDDVLLKHAQESGCEVRQGTVVREVIFDKDGAKVTFVNNGQTTEVRTRWVIDASGRDTFLARSLNLTKEPLPLPKRIAIYGHFDNVVRYEGEAEGVITVVRLEDGWFWIIPLADKTSVGMVRTLETFNRLGRDAEACFAETVAGSATLRDRMKNAQRIGKTHVTSDYTFSYSTLGGPRYLLVGDAGTFIDPIFSSGVFMAMRSASLAAKMIGKADAESRSLRDGELAAYKRDVHSLRNVYLKMIQAFYDNDSFAIFMQPAHRFKLVAAVNSILAGNADVGFGVRWRLQAFYFFCWLQRRRKIVQPVNFTERAAPQPVAQT